MKHRTFGRSGIKVSEIIFGAGAVGMGPLPPDVLARLNTLYESDFKKMGPV